MMYLRNPSSNRKKLCERGLSFTELFSDKRMANVKEVSTKIFKNVEFVILLIILMYSIEVHYNLTDIEER